MKLYLAGPMTGYKDFNFPAFHKAAAELRAMGHEVFSPAEKDIEQHGNVFEGDGDAKILAQTTKFNLRDALGLDLAWICAYGEGIALLQGWEKSKGATAENATAVALGLKRIIQDFEGNWVEIGQ